MEEHLTVGRVAELAGVTVRALHHYDEIGLVQPSARTAAGYRAYSAGDVERLREVLAYRRLGFGLREIADLVGDPSTDATAHLRRLRGLLVEQRDRADAMVTAIDRELEVQAMGMRMTSEEQLEMFGARLYDAIGGAYTATRRTEPRIAARIWDALGDARTVLNVGAGTGSYEPADRDVTAVEPSAVMRACRPAGAPPCVAAAAESLPFPDQSFDAAMAGKTSLLDIAVFLLATTIDRRVGRRRIFFIVDRRLVVDEAFEHAKALAAALRDSAEGNPLHEVARSLRNLYGGGPEDPALIVQRMRGGTTWDASWVDRPDQPAVVTGTIDQVGSRAFFRGYGTSNGRKPMDAALVMMDSLLLIDEAHIARALADNIGRALEADRPEVELPVEKASVVLMSATPAERVGEGKAPSPAFDVEANLTHPVARERLLADKSLRLAKVVDRQRVPTTLSAVTLDLLKERPGARALVVCNTIQRARATREEIRRGLKTSGLQLIPDSDEPDAVPQVKLLIGRSRPVDRDAVVKKLLKSFGMRRSRVEGETGVDILVATQTVEVGANLDVDILVTESAPLDALAQRLGRLNRAGKSKHQPIAVVVHDGQLETVYGDARLAAWDYLSSSLAFDERFPESTTLRAGHRDAGPLAVRKLLEAAPPKVSTRWDEAPIVTTPVLDTWVQTGPIPDLDTQVSQYLHGYQRRDTDVLVCWRDDLTTAGGQLLERNLSAIINATSPLAEELVEVPLRALRSWLMGGKNTDAADFDAPLEEGRTPEAEAQVVVHRNDRWQITHPNRIRPGEIVVVASDRGGLDEFGWNPGSREPAQDIWEIASMRRGRTVLRLDERTLERILNDAPDRSTVEAANEAIRDLVRALANPELNDLPEAIIRIPTKAGKLLQSLGFTDKSDQDEGSEETDAFGAAIWIITKFGKDGHVREPYVQIVQDLDKAQKSEKSQDRVEVVAIADDRLLLTLPKRAGKRERRQQPSGEDASELGSSASTHEVTLDRHHANVRLRAEEIARNVGFTDPVLTQVVADAAGFHDLGKLDLRFQASLRRGDRIAAEMAAEPLAKSDVDPRSTEARRARRVAQVPAGFRHEAWSARLVSQSAPVSGDPRIHDLLVHLVASHHGHSRPLLPIVMDADPQELSHNGWTTLTEGAASVDFEGPRRFLDLNAWLGRWGLAYLETIVRSADQTCSMEGT